MPGDRAGAAARLAAARAGDPADHRPDAPLSPAGCLRAADSGSVSGADLALRWFATFLAATSPPPASLSLITRRHVEACKPWLAARPGQNKPRLTTATIAHRLGTLRMFFARIDEWGWREAPARVPMFPGDLPSLDRPLPRALDDAAAARLLRAAAGLLE